MSRGAIQTLPAGQWRVGASGSRRIERALPEEAAIGISYDSEPYAVLMATPADLADLATGFTISERIAAAGDILDVRIGEHEAGFVADVLLSPAGRRTAGDRRRRNLEGRSSCGLCGVQRPEDALRALPRLAPGFRVGREAVQSALAALSAEQVLGQATHATHAAGWADASGALRLVREDIGRHNALDKLIGAGARTGLDAASAFFVITSRCSYEMVEKTVTAGAPLLVAISAPTDLAVRMAAAANLTLIALARADGHMVFAGAERIAGEAVLDA